MKTIKSKVPIKDKTNINPPPPFPSLPLQDLPINIRFCFEGMEESDSEGLDELVLSRKDSFFNDVDYVCISDNYWLGKTKPCITYGLRGICYFFVEVRKRSLLSVCFMVYLMSHCFYSDCHMSLKGILWTRWNALIRICILGCSEALSMKPWLTWLLSWVSYDVQEHMQKEGQSSFNNIVYRIPGNWKS